jgi:hypothetical protein
MIPIWSFFMRAPCSASTWQLLQKLADGASEARLTREAKASLERLAERSSRKP